MADQSTPAITWHRPDRANRPTADLMSHIDIARAAGVTRAAVSRWAKRPDWPTPVATVTGGPAPRSLYDRDEITAWLDAHPPQPARKRKPAEQLAQRRRQLARLEDLVAQLRSEITELEGRTDPA